MKLKDFLIKMEKECEDLVNIRIDFDLGLDINMDVNEKSKNRIRFSIIKSGGKKK